MSHDYLTSEAYEKNVATIAVIEDRAVFFTNYKNQRTSHIEKLFDKYSKCAYAESKRESFYLGACAVLAHLGSDETLSYDERIKFARELLVEAEQFLANRQIIEPPSWLK